MLDRPISAVEAQKAFVCVVSAIKMQLPIIRDRNVPIMHISMAKSR